MTAGRDGAAPAAGAPDAGAEALSRRRATRRLPISSAAERASSAIPIHTPGSRTSWVAQSAISPPIVRATGKSPVR
ncbi:hypothetical protein A6A07_01910 [Streptomyces sp. CB03911]|nr:hypothetical protein A6A07_01910 [Streptomyces sp. CB03911]